MDSAYDTPSILPSCALPIVPRNLGSWDAQERPPVSCNHMLPDSVQGARLTLMFDMGVSDAARKALGLYERAVVEIGFTSPSEFVWKFGGPTTTLPTGGKYVWGRMYNSQYALLQLIFLGGTMNVELELRAKTPYYGEALSTLGMATFVLDTGGSIQ